MFNNQTKSERKKIRFGVDDDGIEVGVKNPVQACTDIENRINDSISPLPVDYQRVFLRKNI